jgi:hypothetical protein
MGETDDQSTIIEAARREGILITVSHEFDINLFEF